MYPPKIKELAIKHYNNGLSYRKVAVVRMFLNVWIYSN